MERLPRSLRSLAMTGSVILDSDLATLYGVTTSYLTRQVRRNIDRFPDDFMFRLTKEETRNLMCQNGLSSWGGTRKPPFAFTEQGVAMLSSVLRSKRASQINIRIIRVFVRLRQMFATHKDLQKKVEEHDGQIRYLFGAIKKLLSPPRSPRKKIGFAAG